jgi:hypothetical protein
MRKMVTRALRGLRACVLELRGLSLAVAKREPIPYGFERCGRCSLVFTKRNVHVHRFVDHGVDIPEGVNLGSPQSARSELARSGVEQTRASNWYLRERAEGRGRAY